MSDKNTIMELAVSIILIVVLFLFLSPIDLLMPMSHITMLGVLVVLLFMVFSGLIWREKAHDERENVHVMGAGRFSFIVGLLIAIGGILTESLRHKIDPWLVFTAVGMILAKVIFRLYSARKN